jgi:hypothetical protein
MGEKRNACRDLVQKHGGRSPFVKSRGRWCDRLLDFKSMRWKNIKWIYLALDRGSGGLMCRG